MVETVSAARNRPFPPGTFGLGYRPPQLDELVALAERSLTEGGVSPIGYLELISENFLEPRAVTSRALAALTRYYPVVLHGVGLGLLGRDEPEQPYLDALLRLAERVNARFVTDHLCWTGVHGHALHDLLPAPYTEETLAIAVERAARVQAFLGIPFGIENVSSYVRFTESTLSEAEFTVRVVREAGCGLLFDVNNAVVSAHNHGTDVAEWLAQLDYSAILQVHLAGYSVEPSGLYVDTHDQPVHDDTWRFYSQLCGRAGALPTLLEWDEHIPSLARSLAELGRAAELARGAGVATTFSAPEGRS